MSGEIRSNRRDILEFALGLRPRLVMVTDYSIIGPNDLTATRRSQKLTISPIRSKEGKFESKLEYEDLQTTILAEQDDFT